MTASSSAAPSTESVARPAERTVAILASFTSQPAWGVRELAATLGYPRSSVHRILQDLAKDGFLIESDGTYRVMPTLLRFALDLVSSFRVPRMAAPHLEAARDSSGETTIMMLYDRGRRQISGVASAESILPVRFSPDAASSFSDIHIGASGRGVLAFLPFEEQQRIISALSDPPAGSSYRSKAELLLELQRTRERGWASSTSERFTGVRAVAAPVYGSQGYLIGDVLIVWPDQVGTRSTEEELGPLAKKTAAAISFDMGAALN